MITVASNDRIPFDLAHNKCAKGESTYLLWQPFPHVIHKDQSVKTTHLWRESNRDMDMARAIPACQLPSLNQMAALRRRHSRITF